MAVGLSIDSKGYIGTGRRYSGAYYKDFWEYDTLSNTWTQKADFSSTARGGAVGFSIGSIGYIGTGYTGTYKKDFWAYDPQSNTWQQKTNFGGSVRGYAIGFSIGSKGYIGTGWESGVGTHIDFWEYDPIAYTWKQNADFSGTGRDNAVGFSIGTKGYICTGSDNTICYKDFWQFSPLISALNDSKELNKFKIYPNPTNREITIESAENTTVQLLNIQGQVIKEIRIKTEKETIDMSELEANIYFLKAENNNDFKLTKVIKL